jgi:hypothetical protein
MIDYPPTTYCTYFFKSHNNIRVSVINLNSWIPDSKQIFTDPEHCFQGTCTRNLQNYRIQHVKQLRTIFHCITACSALLVVLAYLLF